MRPRLVAFAALGSVFLGACAGAPQRPVSDEPEVVLVVDEEGPWTSVPIEADPDADADVAAAPSPTPSRVASPAPAQPPPRSPSRPVLPVPARRATREPAALGQPASKSPRELARARHLDHPTRIRAQKITFYCPAVYLREVRLTGQAVEPKGTDHRVARGQARLLCRELTLEAETITLRVRREADASLQITARGGVAFVTDQRGQVLREEGVRTLILTNEKVVPLR